MRPRHCLVFAAAAALAACARPAPLPPPVANPPSPIEQIRQGMGFREVESILGPPTDRDLPHITGKVFIPFYFGDDAVEATWYYKDLGRVVFSSGTFSPWAVEEVVPDPNEPGYYRR